MTIGQMVAVVMGALGLFAIAALIYLVLTSLTGRKAPEQRVTMDTNLGPRTISKSLAGKRERWQDARRKGDLEEQSIIDGVKE